MNKALFYTVLITFGVTLCFSCDGVSTDEEKAAAVADSFATQYFTWHFPDALRFADEHGKRWLRFMSSNVHDADLDEISKASVPPSFELGTPDITNDTASVKVSLHDVILMDTLGSRAHMQKDAERTIILVKNQDRWKVHSIQ